MSEILNEDSKVDTAKLLETLKKKADLLGISYAPTIGAVKLKAKIDTFMEDKGGNEPVNETTVGPNKSLFELEKAAKKPILAIISDLDSSQQGDPTIVQNIGNKFFKVGCIVIKGETQLIPFAIIKSLQAKTMVQWQDEKHAITKRPTGNKVARTTKRYSVEIIDDNPDVSKIK